MKRSGSRRILPSGAIDARLRRISGELSSPLFLGLRYFCDWLRCDRSFLGGRCGLTPAGVHPAPRGCPDPASSAAPTSTAASATAAEAASKKCASAMYADTSTAPATDTCSAATDTCSAAADTCTGSHAAD